MGYMEVRYSLLCYVFVYITGQVECVPGRHLEMYQTVKVLYKCEMDKDGKKYILVYTCYTYISKCLQ